MVENRCNNRLRNRAENEDSPLLTRNRSSATNCKTACKNFCVSSKAAFVILLWSLLMCFHSHLLLNQDVYIGIVGVSVQIYGSLFIGFGLKAFVLMFYPLAGFVGDVKCGRYKIVKISLYLVLTAIIAVPLLFAFSELMLSVRNDSSVLYSILVVVLSAVVVVFLCMLYVGVVIFSANVIQFGLDQLHESPAQDSSLFIHWYIWVYYVSMLIVQLAVTMVGYDHFKFHWHDKHLSFFLTPTMILGIAILFLISASSIFLLITSLCVAHRRKKWFLIEPGRIANPYRLVYRVTKFAFQHKIPVRRSAFTYCEDELPSRLDLGKEKYGGPFTTEEVEDVKVFYGILKVLFSFGPVFFLLIASSSMLPVYAQHWSGRYVLYFNSSNTSVTGSFNQHFFKTILVSNGLLSPLLIAVFIPLYLGCFRRTFLDLVPGILKRMGIGFFISLLILVCTFTMDIIGHMRSNENNIIAYCMFNIVSVDSAQIFYNTTTAPSPSQNVILLVVQLFLTALSQMFVYVAIFEFICAQSPHNMKGLLIGLSLAIKGLFQLLAASFVVPFLFWKPSFPSCGFGYYLANLVIGLIAFVAFVWVSKRYKYRERDEPSNVRRYAEDYYSNIQDREYDYSESYSITS